MVIECGGVGPVHRGRREQEEEEEGISLGIPVCEALDLETIEQTVSRSSAAPPTSNQDQIVVSLFS